jgi:hypothetical protein
MKSARRHLILAVIFGTLAGCNAGPSDDQIKHDFTRLRASSAEEWTIRIQEIARGDGWGDGMEGVVRYDACKRAANNRMACARRSESFGYAKRKDGSWEMIFPDR